MKTQRTLSKRGFTLMELMVAMAITTIIVTVLVSITSIALDTWNRSRAELRASRQAKSMVDSLARDFESLVTRRGNVNEWLSAVSAKTMPGNQIQSTNASELIFFTAATDRYDGNVGSPNDDKGGDVSCVAYELAYKNPITGGKADFETFVLNRLLVNPDETFTNLLGKTDLPAAFTTYKPKLSQPENFVCENIYQFTVTFHLQVPIVKGTGTTYEDASVTVGQTATTTTVESFKVNGAGNIVSSGVGSYTTDQLQSARLTGVEIGATVISDFGIDQLRTRKFTAAQQSEFLVKNSYQYSKLVQLPSM